MDKFFRKTKGAISIFLVIVLLPMMTVASVFVDMSRIKLAKSMAESAGDLTLNTALTNYDSEMKNLYGLFATSQNMDELMGNLEDYYRDSIVAAGVDSAAAEDYVGQIMDYLKTTTGDDDLMNIDLTGFEVSVPTGGHLGNPAILKSQIVEFMKYRAPLSLGTGFLDALTTLKDLSKQTELVEDKNEFYEEHQDLLETLEDIWWQLQMYQYADADDGFPTGNYLITEGGKMAANAKLWKENALVADAVKYLYRYNSFKNLLTGSGTLQYEIELEYCCPECDTACQEDKTSCTACQTKLKKDLEHQKWSLTWQGKKNTVEPYYTESEPATADNVVEWLNATLNAIEQVKNYTTGAYNKGYLAASTPTSASTVERIYNVCIFNEELNKSNHYLKTVKTLLESLVQLNAAVNTCDEEELSKTKVVKIDGGNYKIETSTGGTGILNFTTTNLKHLSLEAGGYLDMFNQTVSRVNGHYSATSATVENARKSVTKGIDGIRDQARAYRDMLDTKIGNLSTAITLLGNVKTALTDTTSEYYKALQNWKTSANNLSGNTMGKNDLAEIEDVTSIVTEPRVTTLINRLTKARTTLEDVRNEVAKYVFAGSICYDIQDNVNVSGAIKLLSSWDTEIKNIVPKSDSAYDSVITKIEQTVETGNITNTWGESESSPDLTKQQRELYTWLYNNFYQAVSNYSTAKEPAQTNASDKDVESMEADMKKQADDQKCTTAKTASTDVKRDISKYLDPDLKALPSTRWGETQAAIAAGAIKTDADEMLAESNKANGNMLDTLLSIASNMGTALRDKLYVTEYIMSMFSYDTIEAELYVKENGKYDGYEAFYAAPAEGSTEYTVKKDFAKYAEKIETMTNNSINPNMNYLYGEEVEYILYGSGGAAGVYGTIFVLRFALNTVYAFTDAEINSVTMSAATALFGTPPLTPLIPFAKAAMTIGLAIAESAWDLVELRKGEAVPLMKNSETWVMKPSGIASTVKDELVSVTTSAVNKVVDKGYEVLSEAIEMTSDELSALIKDTKDGLSNLTSATIATITDQCYNYANEALQEVVELCNIANQEAMLSPEYSGLGATESKVEKVKAGLNDWLTGQEGQDPVVLEVKTLTVNYLLENDNQQIKEIFNTLSNQAKPDALTNLLETKLGDIRRVIEVKVDGLLNQAGSKLNEMQVNLTNKLKESAAQGAEKLKETLSNEISGAFGVVPTTENKQAKAASTNSVVASLLSWTYSDYLRIFVVVGMMANEELMLLRIADMIELNMQKKNNEYAVITTTETVTKSRFFGLWKTTEEKEVNSVNKKAFSLTNSYTYLTIKATLQVKPLLMTLPFMADTVENQMTGTNWYEIEYQGTLGY